MKNSYRISLSVRGYYVEKKEYFMCFSRWKPYITYLGTSDTFFYKTKEDAIEGLERKLKEDALHIHLFDNTQEGKN